eukprot:scaffold13329_cov209-Alexandrium_tamarense.AAC.26
MQLMVVGGALLPRKCVYVQSFLTADGGQGSLRVVETRPLLTNHHVAQLTREPGVTTDSFSDKFLVLFSGNSARSTAGNTEA